MKISYINIMINDVIGKDFFLRYFTYFNNYETYEIVPQGKISYRWVNKSYFVNKKGYGYKQI